MKDTQQMQDSIEVRSLEIVRLLLNTGKAKNDDGVKVFKEDVDLLTKQINKVLLRIDKREKDIKELERDIFGITDAEIKVS